MKDIPFIKIRIKIEECGAECGVQVQRHKGAMAQRRDEETERLRDTVKQQAARLQDRKLSTPPADEIQ
jgi:hypothetical protein